MPAVARLPGAVRRHVRRARTRVTRERLRWTVRVRATVIAVFLAVAVVGWVRGGLPSLVPALVAATAGAAMNLLAARRVARWERIPSMLLWTGSGDAVLITYVVVATGGTASPFLFVYVLQVLTTALVVDVGLGATMGLTSIVLLCLATTAWRAPLATAPVDATVWIASFGVTLSLLVFVGGILTRRLARSERALAGTHRRLARSLRRLTMAHGSLQDAYGRLARAEAELVETDRMKTLQLLVAGLAHELGNPLAVLAGNVEPLGESLRAYERALDACAPLAAGACADGDEVESAFADAARAALADAVVARDETPLLLANCTEATSRAIALLGQLRDFGRGGRGTVRRPAPMAAGLAGTVALLRYRLPKGVTVHESYGDVPDVVCVPAEINQVSINLVMNAIDALAAGGHLWLGLDRDGDDVRIVVRDDGAGIDPEILPRVFEPFVTTKEAGRGTGLGLAISRAIVARHGGRIDVASARGEGTTVTVRLPIAGPGRPSATSAPEIGRRPHVEAVA